MLPELKKESSTALGWKGKKPPKWRGSQITFSKKSKRPLKGIEEEGSNADLATRAGWLRTTAGHHAKLANKLINVARTIKTKAINVAKAEEKLKTNEVTMKTYKELAERGSKKENLSDEQKAIIKEGWKRKREKKKRD